MLKWYPKIAKSFMKTQLHILQRGLLFLEALKWIVLKLYNFPYCACRSK